MSLIKDRLVTTRLMLGNRSDLDDRIPVWTANSYVELASNIPFPDLEDTDDISTVGGADTYDYPTNARGITSCTMFVQNTPRPLKKKNIEYIDLYPTLTRGIPAIWAPFNYKQVIRPVPDTSYLIRRRFWKQPVVAFTDTDSINATILALPPDWLEVIDYMAALRGWMELLNTKKVAEIRQVLYGDPNHPDENPGLIKQHLTPIQSENMNSDYGMRMKIRIYTSR